MKFSSQPSLRMITVRGFSLLEMLVVVALIGLFALVVISQSAWVDDGREVEQERARLHDTLALLHERSLFAGELGGLHIHDGGWEPMIFDRYEQRFIPLQERNLRSVSLPENLQLVWLMDDGNNEEPDSLRALSQSLLDRAESQRADSAERAGQDDAVAEQEHPFPQLFFFPSGETSPVTLTVRSQNDIDIQARVQLSSLGRVSNPDQEAP